MPRPTTTLLTAAMLGGLIARLRRPPMPLHRRAVLITGGSRGLGLALAREFAAAGARVAICARNRVQVEGAAAELRAAGADAVGLTCDVSDPDDVARMVATVADRFGGIDVLVNNAGTITVGPLAAQTAEDFQTALDTMFWGTYHPTMAALPHLRAAPWGRVVTIGSIGGKVAPPHLLPYAVAKFAAVGFSEGLRAELAREGVLVTTVIPGLMRTGSHVNALTKGRHAAEYRWFGLSASLPVTATSAEHAARRIVAAARRGDAEVILTWQAHVAVRLHGLAPALTARLAGLANRLLPSAPDSAGARRAVRGRDTGVDLGIPGRLGDRAAERHRQEAEPP